MAYAIASLSYQTMQAVEKNIEQINIKRRKGRLHEPKIRKF